MSAPSLTPSGGAAFPLPEGLYWEDRGRWQATRQVIKALLPDANGDASILIQESRLLAGRPITLVSSQNTGWMSYGEVKGLLALTSSPPDMVLHWDNVNYTVRFRFDNGDAVEWDPLMGAYAPHNLTDDMECRVTIKLIEI